jgi:hypothetical protein
MGASAPEAKASCPFDHADWLSSILSADVDAVRASMKHDSGARVREAFSTTHELVTMSPVRRVKVQSCGMTQVPFSQKIGENNDLVARPMSAA